MTRTRRFANAIWSGYMLTGVTSILNLITIPIALAALGKETFGLWSAVLQVTVLAGVFDMGLGPSLARFITDYKDRPDPSEYARFIKSVMVVAWVQTLVFVTISALVIPVLPAIMSIPAPQAGLFQWLVAIQLGTTALGFPLRVFSQILYANQQLATLNAVAIAGTVCYSIVLVAGLYGGMGVHSYVAANWGSFLVIQTCSVVLVLRRNLMPPLRRARISFGLLKPLASFSSEVMLIVIGLQLMAFAPTLLITRKMGLLALADWTVGTRLVLLAWQLITRITGSSEPIFWEMYSRGEVSRLRPRLLDLGLLAASMAALFAGGIVALNAPFVALWTGSRVEWWTGTDGVLFLWIAFFTVASVFNMVPGITKHVGAMKFIYMLEGLILVGLAYAPFAKIGKAWHVALVLFLAVVCFRFPYGVWRACCDLSITRQDLARFLCRCFATAILLLAVALVARLATSRMPPLAQVVVNGVIFTAVALPAIYLISLPSDLQRKLSEAWRKVPWRGWLPR